MTRNEWWTIVLLLGVGDITLIVICAYLRYLYDLQHTQWQLWMSDRKIAYEQQRLSRSYTWGTARKGNLGYVEETCIQNGEVLYRKQFEMPASVVPAFVVGRRRCVAMEMQEQGHPYVVRDSGSVN